MKKANLGSAIGWERSQRPMRERLLRRGGAGLAASAGLAAGAPPSSTARSARALAVASATTLRVSRSEGEHQPDHGEADVDPVGARDADRVAHGREEGGEPAAQVHQGVEHGVAHAGRLGGRELPHRRRRPPAGTCRSRARRTGCRPASPGGPATTSRPAGRPKVGPPASSTRPTTMQHERRQQGDADAPLVGEPAEEEHRERDAPGQHPDHAARPACRSGPT